MLKPVLAAISLGGLLLAAPAWAGYVEATYSGTLGQVAATAPASLAVGTPITFDVVFDPSKAVDRTAVVNAYAHATIFNSVNLVSLSDDPLASLTITVGGITFTKFDQSNYGTPGSLGAGDFPQAEYLNGSFRGVGNIFVNSQGYSLDADPIADAVIRHINNPAGSEFGLGGPQTGNFDFYLGTGTTSRPFGQGLAVGDINLSTLQIMPVPEPSGWPLVLIAISAVTMLRSARRRGRV